MALDIEADRFTALDASAVERILSGPAVSVRPALPGGLRTLPRDQPRDRAVVPRFTQIALRGIAWIELLRWERRRRAGLGCLLDRIEQTPIGDPSPLSVDDLLARVDDAASWLPFDAECLTRAAALTSILRRYGHPARLVVGVQQYPFVAHAWSAVEDEVVGDDPELGKRLARLIVT